MVERTHSWRNRFRQLLIRWKQNIEHDLTMLHVACAWMTFRAARVCGLASAGPLLPDGGGTGRYARLQPVVHRRKAVVHMRQPVVYRRKAAVRGGTIGFSRSCTA